MSYNNDLEYELNDSSFNVDYINNLCAQNPGKRVLIVIQNTRGISSQQLLKLNDSVKIKIIGGYTKERIEHMRYNIYFDTAHYNDAVIYTKNEVIDMIKEMENIESHLNDNWTQYEKVMYIYDILQRTIMYDPRYETKPSSETQSLRGLISKKTICAGFASILKEMLDRQDIKCEYVEGYTKDINGKIGGHAWNIIEIEGKKYGVDLSMGNALFRNGRFNFFEFLGQKPEEFMKLHIPEAQEDTQHYESTLSQLDQDIVKRCIAKFDILKDYMSRIYCINRADNSRCILAQLDDVTEEDGKICFRYYYSEIGKDGRKQSPVILYSHTNIAHLIEAKNFNYKIPEGFQNSVTNLLFSKENISNSISRGTLYIGKVIRERSGDVPQFVTSVDEIEKNEETQRKYSFPIRNFVRSDGSMLVAQQISEPFDVCGKTITQYDIFEMEEESGLCSIKKTKIFTETDIIKDQRQSIADIFLSKERLRNERILQYASGYFGSYDSNNALAWDRAVASYFRTYGETLLTKINYNVQPSTAKKTFK